MQKIDYSGFAPSFSCYSSNTTTSTAVAKAIREQDDFEFSLMLIDKDVSDKKIDSTVFKREYLPIIIDDVDREIRATDTVTGQLGQLFINKREESYSCSSSEADELESPLSITKCKKSSSTGSTRSKRGILFRCLFQRSNSEGEERKKVDSVKHKRNSGEESIFGGRWKAQTPVHEQFYVRKRAENEMGKRRSYLPYRKDLVGLFANVKGMGKLLPF